jgi:hypothetical protein
MWAQRHFGPFSPLATKSNTPAIGRLMAMVRCADGMAVLSLDSDFCGRVRSSEGTGHQLVETCRRSRLAHLGKLLG